MTKLTRERVIDGAVRLADRVGVDALTIRKIADEIDVKPMTIYHHVANKEAIIDGMVDAVFAEIDLPAVDTDWRDAIRLRCHSMRAVLAHHPWASPLMENRTKPGPATLAHHDAVLGCLRSAGFSYPHIAHAYAIIDAFMYGFALQEATLPATGGEDMIDLAVSITESIPADLYPNLVGFTQHHVMQPGYDFGRSFEVGLELILEGIARMGT